MTVRIRSIESRDAAGWLRLRCELWPGADAEHRENIDRYFAGDLREPLAVLVAEDGDDLVGTGQIRCYRKSL